MELYGQTVSKVYHKKDGSSTDKEGKSWDWRLWNIYFDGFDGSFTLFTSGKKPEPFEGMKVAYIKYKEETTVSEKDGKTYTNRTIDEFKLSEESPEPSTQPVSTSFLAPSQPLPQPQPKKEVDWDAIAFKKCKFGFLKEAFVPYIKGEISNFVSSSMDDMIELEKMAEEFAKMCMRVISDSPTATQEPSQAKDIVGDAKEPNVDVDDPFGDTMGEK